MHRLRAIGLQRAGIVLGLAVTTWVFFLLARNDRGSAVLGGVMIEVLLITVVQEGITRRERVVFSTAAAILGFIALVTGTLAAR
jgi:hypothetical protein